MKRLSKVLGIMPMRKKTLYATNLTLVSENRSAV
jgi:hypothetical protein